MRIGRIRGSLDELQPGEMASVIAEVRGLDSAAHAAEPHLRTDRWPGASRAQVRLVQRDLSEREVSRRADGGGLRQGGAVAVEQQPEDDSAAV